MRSRTPVSVAAGALEVEWATVKSARSLRGTASLRRGGRARGRIP